jgi:uncharacterized protein YuzE
LYIRLDETPVSESQEVAPGLVLDFDANDRVVGIEVLDVRKRLPKAHLNQMDFEIV